MSHSFPRLQDLPFHLERIIRACILLEVSCPLSPAVQLEPRVRRVFILDVGSRITTPWLIFTTFLGATPFDLASGERSCRVFPARREAH